MGGGLCSMKGGTLYSVLGSCAGPYVGVLLVLNPTGVLVFDSLLGGHVLDLLDGRVTIPD